MKYQVIKSVYNFKCTMCGNCCTGDQRVNLNLYDLYKMAAYRGFNSTAQLFNDKTVHLVFSQNNRWLPQIKFTTLNKNRGKAQFVKRDLSFCPFLINELGEGGALKGRCSLHPYKKPLICSMAPVGRIVDLSKQTEEFVFVKPAPDCPGVDIKNENKLENLKLAMVDELVYEKQFYIMLDGLKENYSKSFYRDTVYSFPIYSPFEDILAGIQENLKRY